MSRYLVGCEVVASSLLLYLCVMEALYHPAHSPTQEVDVRAVVYHLHGKMVDFFLMHLGK